MDVDRRSFAWQLPRILRAIRDAHFVAFDLELSGIPSKASHRVKSGAGQSNKQTLQQRYEEAKEAAERYQILQVGLTCVTEDNERSIYITRPYNFFLNPIPEEKLDIERIFSFQSSAVEFIMSYGFPMDVPFRDGVSYLSRQEEGQARQLELERQDKSKIMDITIKDNDLETLSFAAKVRADILKWKNRTTLSPEYLNIAPDGYEFAPFPERGLNGFQKRLVYQILRSEHPELVALPRHGFLQIIPYDKKRENTIKEQKQAAFKEKLSRQTGLRWIIEAMVGGDLSGINVMNFARNSQGQAHWIDLKEFQRDFDELRIKLSSKRTVLIGHNLFMDLIYLYHTFLGILPDQVEDFQQTIHQLFPFIVDTKYLATQNNVDSNAKSGLEELNQEMEKVPVPLIEFHKDHPNYDLRTAHHEAGYDSYLTAKVLIRKSAELESSGTYVDYNPKGLISNSIPKQPSALHMQIDDSVNTVSSSVKSTFHQSQSDKPKKKKVKKDPAQSKFSSAFSHPNLFEALGSQSSHESNDDHDDEAFYTPDEDSKEGYTPPGAMPDKDDLISWTTPPKVKRKAVSSMMPPWDSHFWTHYANRLRVNGTVEGVCVLASGETTEEASLE